MEKPNLNISLSTSLHTIRGVVLRSMDPDIMWRFVMASFLCGMVAIGVVAYLTYSWAGGVVVAPAPTKSKPAEFSLEELRGVIRAYQAKEETYNTLLRTPPIPPSYARGKGIATLPVSASSTPPSLIGTSTTQGTTTPSVLR